VLFEAFMPGNAHGYCGEYSSPGAKSVNASAAKRSHHSKEIRQPEKIASLRSQ
jgi:hypothetical protein